MDNRPDFELIDHDQFQLSQQNLQTHSFPIQQIPTDQRETQGTTQQVHDITMPGLTKNIPKQFGRALKNYIMESFAKEEIESNPTLYVFVNLNPEKYSQVVLKEFLQTLIGRQIGQIFFGCGKFCKYIITNQKSTLSLKDLFKEIPKYYQCQSCFNNQVTINYDDYFIDFDHSSQFYSRENRSTIGYIIDPQLDEESQNE